MLTQFMQRSPTRENGQIYQEVLAPFIEHASPLVEVSNNEQMFQIYKPLQNLHHVCLYFVI